MDSDIMKHGKGKQKFDGVNDEWIWSGWRKLLYIPSSYLPCYESSIAIHEDGELAYVDEYGKIISSDIFSEVISIGSGKHHLFRFEEF